MITEASMKVLFSLLLLAAVIIAARGGPLEMHHDPLMKNSFVVAQRYCPNGRC
jgi:hypothetical protein